MGYMFVLGICVACKKPISFNPVKVPSLRINGTKEPICETCANRWNQLHPAEARPIDPAAYTFCDENELN